MAKNHDPSYRISIIRDSRHGKTSASFNLISQEINIDQIYLYAKDPYEVKYQLLINKRENSGIKHYNDSKAFSEYLKNIDDIYKKC